MDLEKFKKQSEELEKIISQMAAEKYNIVLDQRNSQTAFNIINQKDYQVPVSPKGTKYSYCEYLDYKSKLITTPIDYNNLLDYHQSDYTSFLPGKTYNKIQSNSICFFKNSSLATCYKLNVQYEDIINLFSHSVQSLLINTSLGKDGYGDVIASSGELYFFSNLVDTTKNIVWIAPEFFISNPEYPPIWTFSTLVFIHIHQMDIPQEKLSELTEMTGQWIVSPSNLVIRGNGYRSSIDSPSK